MDLFLFSILFSLVLALLVGMLMAWIWTLARIWSGRPLLDDVPIFPLREAPWGTPTVFAVILLYLLVNASVSRTYAAATGRTPPHAVEAGRAKADDAKDKEEDGSKEVGAEATGHTGVQERQPEKPREAEAQTQSDLLVQLALINGILVVLVPGLLRITSGARLADLGLTLVEWKRQMSLGVSAALLMIPAVYAVQSMAVRVWKPQKHPVEQMVLGEFSFAIAMLAIVSTVILAPLIEEILFRGIVQHWLTRLLSRSSSAMAPNKTHKSVEATPEEDPLYKASLEQAPTWDPPDLTGLGGISTPQAEPSTGAWLPAVLTSLIFATLHATQWPAPVAIFLLSMALGVLYQSTGSLLSVATMHATFNGFSTLLLLLEAIRRQSIDNPAGVNAAIWLDLASFLVF